VNYKYGNIVVEFATYYAQLIVFKCKCTYLIFQVRHTINSVRNVCTNHCTTQIMQDNASITNHLKQSALRKCPQNLHFKIKFHSPI
jgi:hypothetical protein